MTTPEVSYVCVPSRLWTSYAEMCAAAGYVLRPVVQQPGSAPRFNLDDTVTRNLHAGGHDLSERQYQLLVAFAQGAEDREIAARLGLSLNTVKTHGRKLLAKMHARNRTECVARAYRVGLLGGAR